MSGISDEEDLVPSRHPLLQPVELLLGHRQLERPHEPVVLPLSDVRLDGVYVDPSVRGEGVGLLQRVDLVIAGRKGERKERNRSADAGEVEQRPLADDSVNSQLGRDDPRLIQPPARLPQRVLLSSVLHPRDQLSTLRSLDRLLHEPLGLAEVDPLNPSVDPVESLVVKDHGPVVSDVGVVGVGVMRPLVVGGDTVELSSVLDKVARFLLNLSGVADDGEDRRGDGGEELCAD